MGSLYVEMSKNILVQVYKDTTSKNWGGDGSTDPLQLLDVTQSNQ